MKDLMANVVTMSSLEIAELTGKQHKHVMVDIRNMLEQLEIHSAEFSAQYNDSTGRTLPMFSLDKDLTLTLVSGYNVKLRHAIVKRLAELENSANLGLVEGLVSDRISSMLPSIIQDQVLPHVMEEVETLLGDRMDDMSGDLYEQTSRKLGMQYRTSTLDERGVTTTLPYKELRVAHNLKMSEQQFMRAMMGLGLLRKTRDIKFVNGPAMVPMGLGEYFCDYDRTHMNLRFYTTTFYQLLRMFPDFLY